MELVEGEDLSQRIARGAMPLDEVQPIARQIAEALGAAHEQGIIHRDLKPANLKVRPDGTVKVLDFGLAKLAEPAMAGIQTGRTDLTNSPTITSAAMMTGVGVLLGTAAYMSPEQAVGKAVDKRSDLWAFGVVLLEMLTGRQVFRGETVSHVLASVLKDEPDWTALPPRTPVPIRTLLRRSLENDRKRRLADAADARLEIEEASDNRRSGSADAHTCRACLDASGRHARVEGGARRGRHRRQPRLPAVRHIREVPAVDAPEIRLEINTPPTLDPVSLAISPDGRTLVFAATSDGRNRLWLRPLDAVSARPLAGTDAGSLPFWSPDNRFLMNTNTVIEDTPSPITVILNAKPQS
jgi:serine/threonine protein kinase